MSKSNNKVPLSPAHRTYSKVKFEDQYKRMTIYINQDLFNQIQYQREQGIITNLTAFVNKAIMEYLNKS